MKYLLWVGMLSQFANILAMIAADTEEQNSEIGVPTAKVKVYQHSYPEKNKWSISTQKKEKICGGGPYSGWYSFAPTDCKLSEGSYTIKCCDVRTNEGWTGGYVEISRKKLCRKFIFGAKKTCVTEKFAVAKLPTPRPTPKPTPRIFRKNYNLCLEKTAQAIAKSAKNVQKYNKKMFKEMKKNPYICMSNDGCFPQKDLYKTTKIGQYYKSGKYANQGVDIERFSSRVSTEWGDIIFNGWRSKKKYLRGFEALLFLDGFVPAQSWVVSKKKPYKWPHGGEWWAYQHSVYAGSGDPSINHLVLVPEKDWLDQSKIKNGNQDYLYLKRPSPYSGVTHVLHVMWGGPTYKYTQKEIKNIISKLEMEC